MSLLVRGYFDRLNVLSFSDVGVNAPPGHHDPGLASARGHSPGGRGEAPQPRQQPHSRHQGEGDHIQVSRSGSVLSFV